MSYLEAKEIADKIDGWLRDNEARFLYETAKNCKRGVIVEIGSWKGKSTVYLGRGSKDGNGVKVVAIDPHIDAMEHKLWMGGKSSFEEFEENIQKADIKDIVEIIRDTSHNAAKNWSKQIEFLWIDGDHRYEAVKNDFDHYFPYVVNNGIVAFHDSTYGDVQKFVLKIFRENNVEKLGLIGSITYARKKNSSGKIGWMEHCRKYWILFFNLMHKYFWNLPFPSSFRLVVRKLIKG